MAFSIFSKPPASAPDAAAGARPATDKSGPKKPTAPLQEVRARGNGPNTKFTVTRYGTPTERARAAAADKPKPSLELGPASLGFSPALENAALLYASGQAAAARQVLASALKEELDSRAL